MMIKMMSSRMGVIKKALAGGGLLCLRNTSPININNKFNLLSPATSSPLYNFHTQNQNLNTNNLFKLKPTSTSTSTSTVCYFSTRRSDIIPTKDEENDEVEPIDIWEEEDEAEPELGDGGDGGGVVLQGCPWGERALAIARDVLLNFGHDIQLFSFKTSPRGYIYVRLDKIPTKYGCPPIEELEDFSRQYKKRLDEVGADGEIPDDLALDVSSPGAERLLRVPDDLERFKDMAMRVSYVEDVGGRCQEKIGVFFLESNETESGSCVWRLADVKENRLPSAKGRPLSRKQKDWRLKLPYEMCKKITLYLDY